MSAAGVKALRDMAAEDASLMARLQAAMTPAEVVSIAAQKGITLTVEDLELPSGELSEQELAAASGGGLGSLGSFSLMLPKGPALPS